MPSLPWYRRCPADYAADTATLDFQEHGAYTLLLDLQYTTREGLGPFGLVDAPMSELCRNSVGASSELCTNFVLRDPNLALVYRAVRANSRAEKAALRRVLARYFEPREDDDGKWWNPRAYQEVRAMEAARDKMSKAGRNGAVKRWGTPMGSAKGTPRPEAWGTPSEPHWGSDGTRARPDPDLKDLSLRVPSFQDSPPAGARGRARGAGLDDDDRAAAERLQAELEQRRAALGLAAVGSGAGGGVVALSSAAVEVAGRLGAVAGANSEKLGETRSSDEET